MPQQPAGWTARLADWWGIDSGWERVPADPARAYRNDLWLGAAFVVVSLVGAELARSIGYFEDEPAPTWLLYLLSAAGAAPLMWRRRFPLVVLSVVYLHFLVVGLTVPMVTILVPLQVVYFVALFSAVAWARDRQAMVLVVGAALLAMFGWLAWQFAVGAGIDGIVEQMGLADERPGLVDPGVAFTAYNLLINLAYFYGAVVGGQLMWHGARRREQLEAQAATIERQTAELQRQAVVTERLRIARELHDVVAHHVSVIGIQAAAARRMLAGDPATAAAPLATIEGESREAVAQMRGLLGTLRGVEDAAGSAPGGRAPEPGLADVPALADDAGLDVEVRVVAEDGALDAVPAPLGLSLYRTAQEALSNVRKHSTARSARVVVRVDRRPVRRGDPAAERFPHGFAEVEVLDDGRPRPGSSGTGLGLVGVRERVATHGGIADVGPRATGGYRVRVRLPLPEERP
ncbi:sensor histidine kinase [Krasilnikoviella flava]|uniref:histidine kinase n=1 Tax=Krasilnikoviella flava TaxID=526729 RepID=A0A1T5K1V8_9MICO|nr:histidine kinase [Krasilnikoviella flava]SKC57747.1 Signal transduction histidine kinase [Krasilnikoviella flava]